MPTQKDFKRLVRRRMQKTGESYTAARARLLSRRNGTSPRPTRSATRIAANSRASEATSPPRSRPSPAPSEYAKIARMSDAALEKATGCTWKRWVDALDYVNAHTWPHREIATYVHEKFEISGWWSQCVTVGYERIRGLREVGQRRGGSYEASKSKTFAAPIGVVYEAFTNARRRGRWLPGVSLTVRKATRDKSVRITWPDGTSVEVGLASKGDAKSAAAIQHTKLPDKESAARMKAFWTERLDALAVLLAK